MKASSQLTLSTSYIFSKDEFFENKIPIGLEVGYQLHVSKDLFFHFKIESKFARNYKTKSPLFYSNYEPWNINPIYLEAIKYKPWAYREHKNFTIFLLPEINLHYIITPNNSSMIVSLFSGINISLKLYDRYFYSYVFYSEDFTSFRLEDRVNYASRNLYGIYLPLGTYLQFSKFTTSLSYNISLKKKGLNSDWSGIKKRRNNCEIKLGYRF